MKKQSAGLLVYRLEEGKLEVLLVHPGGPYNAKKDLGVWSIPKGEFDGEEEPLEVAMREFKEETSFDIDGEFAPLTPIVQKGGNTVQAWAIEKDMDVTGFSSNTFSMEWPYKSGKYRDFPEVDKAEWLGVEEARQKINPAQAAFIDELLSILNT